MFSEGRWPARDTIWLCSSERNAHRRCCRFFKATVNASSARFSDIREYLQETSSARGESAVKTSRRLCSFLWLQNESTSSGVKCHRRHTPLDTNPPSRTNLPSHTIYRHICRHHSAKSASPTISLGKAWRKRNTSALLRTGRVQLNM